MHPNHARLNVHFFSLQGDRDDNITSSDEVTAEANLLSLATWRPQLLEAKLAHIGFTAESSGDSTSIFHARNLVSRMLQKDPMKRMTLQQVLTHPFLCPGKKVARLHGEQPEYDIFLSYRQATDKDHVETIFNQLQHAGLNVWWDRDSMKKGLKWEGITTPPSTHSSIHPLIYLISPPPSHPLTSSPSTLSQNHFVRVWRTVAPSSRCCLAVPSTTQISTTKISPN